MAPVNKARLYIAVVVVVGLALFLWLPPFLDYLVALSLDCDPLNDYLSELPRLVQPLIHRFFSGVCYGTW